MARAGRGSLGAAGAEWESRLLSAAADQIRATRPDAFLRAYDEFLRRLRASRSDISVCNDVLGALRTRLVRTIGDIKQRTRAEDMLHEARIMTSNALESVQVAARLRAWDDSKRIMAAGAAIVSACNLADLAAVTAVHLPQAGIERYCVLRVPHGADSNAEVAVAQFPGARRADTSRFSKFPSSDALREVLLQDADERAFVIFAAPFANGDQGVVALELGRVEGFGYETLRQIFTSALSRIP